MENYGLKRKSSMPAASLVLGILSIVFSWFGGVAMPTGILAVAFGAEAVNRNGSGVGKSGLVLGIIGLSLYCVCNVWFTLWLVFN